MAQPNSFQTGTETAYLYWNRAMQYSWCFLGQSAELNASVWTCYISSFKLGRCYCSLASFRLNERCFLGKGSSKYESEDYRFILRVAVLYHAHVQRSLMWQTEHKTAIHASQTDMHHIFEHNTNLDHSIHVECAQLFLIGLYDFNWNKWQYLQKFNKVT